MSIGSAGASVTVCLLVVAFSTAAAADQPAAWRVDIDDAAMAAARCVSIGDVGAVGADRGEVPAGAMEVRIGRPWAFCPQISGTPAGLDYRIDPADAALTGPEAHRADADAAHSSERVVVQVREAREPQPARPEKHKPAAGEGHNPTIIIEKAEVTARLGGGPAGDQPRKGGGPERIHVAVAPAGPLAQAHQVIEAVLLQRKVVGMMEDPLLAGQLAITRIKDLAIKSKEPLAGVKMLEKFADTADHPALKRSALFAMSELLEKADKPLAAAELLVRVAGIEGGAGGREAAAGERPLRPGLRIVEALRSALDRHRPEPGRFAPAAPCRPECRCPGQERHEGCRCPLMAPREREELERRERGEREEMERRERGEREEMERRERGERREMRLREPEQVRPGEHDRPGGPEIGEGLEHRADRLGEFVERLLRQNRELEEKIGQIERRCVELKRRAEELERDRQPQPRREAPRERETDREREGPPDRD